MGDIDVALARLDHVIRDQDGAIARAQVIDCGLDSAFVRRRLRSGLWQRIYPGIYLTHTGALAWSQRAWCAVLDAAPAVLSHGSALRAATSGDYALSDDVPIHITVAAGRKVTARKDVVVHHRSLLPRQIHLNLLPPRIRLEEAVLDVAAAAPDDMRAVACLADAVQARRTTPDRLLAALADRHRIRRRALLHTVLGDIRDGACSALEHTFLTRVERAHGLPRGIRQSPTEVGRPGFRDVKYPEFGLVVELDGLAFHDDAVSRDRDLERDLDAAVFAALRTIRLAWGQAHIRSCATATKVGRILQNHGWSSQPRRCTSPTCAVKPPNV